MYSSFSRACGIMTASLVWQEQVSTATWEVSVKWEVNRRLSLCRPSHRIHFFSSLFTAVTEKEIIFLLFLLHALATGQLSLGTKSIKADPGFPQCGRLTLHKEPSETPLRTPGPPTLFPKTLTICKVYPCMVLFSTSSFNGTKLWLYCKLCLLIYCIKKEAGIYSISWGADWL